jgi:hypothetical protein
MHLPGSSGTDVLPGNNGGEEYAFCLERMGVSTSLLWGIPALMVGGLHEEGR